MCYFLGIFSDYLSSILQLFRIRKFPGQTEPTMSAEVELISTIAEKKSWTRPPIQMEFQVPVFLTILEYYFYANKHPEYYSDDRNACHGNVLSRVSLTKVRICYVYV